jgi:hypothetical protein
MVQSELIDRPNPGNANPIIGEPYSHATASTQQRQIAEKVMRKLRNGKRVNQVEEQFGIGDTRFVAIAHAQYAGIPVDAHGRSPGNPQAPVSIPGAARSGICR